VPNVISMNGTICPPNMPNIDVCLKSILKLNYDVFNIMILQGGICICGSSLFFGYYKLEDLIKEVLVDGWVHIGN
jgi:long-chain acyl-CoA synthetase